MTDAARHRDVVHRRDVDHTGLGLRWVLAAVAALLVCVPFLGLLLLVRAENPTLARLDRDLARGSHDFVRDRPWLETLLHVVDVAGHPWVLRALTVVAVVVLWRQGRRRVAAWLAVTMAVGGALGGLLKLVVARSRPVFDDPLATAPGYSFPSGHALNSMLAAGCALVLLHPRTRGAARAALWVAAAAFVLLLGFDRVGLGVHFLSDVLAGWIAALATLAATVAAFALWRREAGLRPATTEAGLDPEHGTEAAGPP